MDSANGTASERHTKGAARGHIGEDPAHRKKSGRAVSDKKGESRVTRWDVGNVKITSIIETADRIPWAPGTSISGGNFRTGQES